MRKKILILGIVVALVAALVVPMAVSAAVPTTTGIQVTGIVMKTGSPIITQPYGSDTSISGTAAHDGAGANISVTVTTGTAGSGPANGTYITIADVTSGAWSVSLGPNALVSGNAISVIAQLNPEVNSSAATTTVGANTATLTPPSNFGWGVTPSSALAVGANKGSAATQGSVVSAGDSWNLNVLDSNTSNVNTEGFMTSGGGYTLPLADAIQFDIAAITTLGGVSGDNIANYVRELAGTSNPAGNVYGQATGTFTIPLYGFQEVLVNDGPGSYTITLNYILSPTI